MKIFANNFAIQFRLGESQPHFHFERSTWAQADAALRTSPRFAGQIHYVDANEIPDLAALEALHTDAWVCTQHAELALVFPDATSLSACQEAYMARFRAVPAAGGLVIDAEQRLLMILRDGKWDLPKGKVEKNEAIADAAWREVAEETGLQHHIRGELATQTFHVFPRADKWRLKATHWYWMQAPHAEAVQPQTAEGITAIRWYTHAELMAEIPETYPQIMELVRLSLTHMHP
jgi:8-oxo-dGTP pyrophosphatase MutT (NUDIX family)